MEELSYVQIRSTSPSDEYLQHIFSCTNEKNISILGEGSREECFNLIAIYIQNHE